MKESKKDETLTEQIETTAKKLATLKAEQSELNSKIRLAVEAADSTAIITLRRRADDLPYEIPATEIRLERLRQQIDEQTLAELESEPAKLYPAVEKAQQAFDEARKQLNWALSEHKGAVDAYQEQRRTVGNRKRRIETLIRESTKSADKGIRSLVQL